MDTALWTGPRETKSGPTGFERFQRDFKKLVGEEHGYKLEEIISQIEDDSDFDDLDPEERGDRIKALNEFNARKKAMNQGGASKTRKVDGSANLKRLVVATPVEGGPQILAVWVRKGSQKADGELLAKAAYTEGAAQFDATVMTGPYGKAEGTLKQGTATHDVLIYSATGGGTAGGGGPSITSYAAVWSANQGSGGSGNKALIGLGASVLGALLAGFVASSLANKHAQGIKSLARDIDRLGTSGDASRGIRAQGAEATQVARAVERMVSNLEFRDKHEGADLDEVVSREQRVAHEIPRRAHEQEPAAA